MTLFVYDVVWTTDGFGRLPLLLPERAPSSSDGIAPRTFARPGLFFARARQDCRLLARQRRKRAAAGPLVLGTLLPATGQLASLSAPQIAGVRAALSAINEAGGVLGSPVRQIEGDSANSEEIASLSLKRSIDQL